MTVATTELAAPIDANRDLNRRFVAFPWIVYLALAPVAWLPGVPPLVFSVTKSLAFAVAVSLTWIYARPRTVPKGLAGPAGLALVAAASVIAAVQTPGLGGSLRATGEVVLAFGILWTVYLLQGQVFPLYRIGGAAALVHAALSLLIVASFLGLVEFHSPEVFGSASIEDIGLGGRRTGWSNGVALFVPLLLAHGIASRRPSVWVVVTFAVGSTLLGQLISGGRLGVAVTLLSLVLMVTFTLGVPGMATGLVAASLSVFLLLSGFAAEFGIDRFDEPVSDVVELSNRRIDLVAFAVEEFSESPVTGQGYDQPVFEGLEIHNVWLRLAAEGGVLLPAALLAVVVSIIAKALKGLWVATRIRGRRAIVEWASLVSVLVGGVAISLAEPNIFLGTMHASAIWWCAAGGVIALHAGATRPRLV